MEAAFPGVSWLQPVGEQALHSLGCVWAKQPALNFEVGDPQRGQEAVLGRKDVAQRVAEGSLPVTPALAREERWLRFAEATAFEPRLLIAAGNPYFRRKGQWRLVGVE